MAGSPISITLYNDDNEVVETYTRVFVPWRLLKAAVRLQKSLDPDNLTEEDVDRIAGLVVEVFGGRFSVADLDDHADVTDMISVITAIVNKANGVLPNPTPPGS